MDAHTQIEKLISNNLLVIDNGFEQFSASYKAGDNNDIINILSESCNLEKEIQGQDTYIFNDGSYVTRCEVTYWIGASINDFEIV